MTGKAHVWIIEAKDLFHTSDRLTIFLSVMIIMLISSLCIMQCKAWYPLLYYHLIFFLIFNSLVTHSRLALLPSSFSLYLSVPCFTYIDVNWPVRSVTDWLRTDIPSFAYHSQGDSLVYLPYVLPRSLPQTIWPTDSDISLPSHMWWISPMRVQTHQETGCSWCGHTNPPFLFFLCEYKSHFFSRRTARLYIYIYINTYRLSAIQSCSWLNNPVT